MESAGRSNSAIHIPPLDGIRGLAILSVLAYHYLDFGSIAPLRDQPWAKLMQTGWIGVDLFFVLSGFLLGGILMDAKGQPDYYRKFYLRRAARILPLYFLWLLAYKAAGVPVGIEYPLFMQNWVRVLGNPAAVGRLEVSWSLAVEEQFYLILPLAIAFLGRPWLRRVLIGWLAAAPLLRWALVAMTHPADAISLYILLPTHGDGLIVGVLVAGALRDRGFDDWYRRHRRAVALAGIALGLDTLLLIMGTPDGIFNPRMVHLYTPIALACGWLVMETAATPDGWIGRAAGLPGLRFFGRISYCLYLVHMPALFGARWWVVYQFGKADSLAGFLWLKLACVAAALGLSIAVCLISARFIEGPILRWARSTPGDPYYRAPEAEGQCLMPNV